MSIVSARQAAENNDEMLADVLSVGDNKGGAFRSAVGVWPTGFKDLTSCERDVLMWRIYAQVFATALRPIFAPVT